MVRRPKVRKINEDGLIVFQNGVIVKKEWEKGKRNNILGDIAIEFKSDKISFFHDCDYYVTAQNWKKIEEKYNSKIFLTDFVKLKNEGIISYRGI